MGQHTHTFNTEKKPVITEEVINSGSCGKLKEQRYISCGKRNLVVNDIQLFAISNKIILKLCRDPGLNQGPSDLQSDALPTELAAA